MIAVSDTGSASRKPFATRFSSVFSTKGAAREPGWGQHGLRLCQTVGRHIKIYSERGMERRSGFIFRGSKRPRSVLSVETPASPRGWAGDILMVEDDPMVDAYASAQIQRLGYKLLAATKRRRGAGADRRWGHIRSVFTDSSCLPMNGRQLADEGGGAGRGPGCLHVGLHRKCLKHHGRLDPDVLRWPNVSNSRFGRLLRTASTQA